MRGKLTALKGLWGKRHSEVKDALRLLQEPVADCPRCGAKLYRIHFALPAIPGWFSVGVEVGGERGSGIGICTCCHCVVHVARGQATSVVVPNTQLTPEERAGHWAWDEPQASPSGVAPEGTGHEQGGDDVQAIPEQA